MSAWPPNVPSKKKKQQQKTNKQTNKQTKKKKKRKKEKTRKKGTELIPVRLSAWSLPPSWPSG